jgi:hypothetical protein
VAAIARSSGERRPRRRTGFLESRRSTADHRAGEKAVAGKQLVGAFAAHDTADAVALDRCAEEETFCPVGVDVQPLGPGHRADEALGDKRVGCPDDTELRTGVRGRTFYTHYSMLRSVEEALGITTYLGNAATANDMRPGMGF